MNVTPDTVDNLIKQCNDALAGLRRIGEQVHITGLYVNDSEEDVVVKAGGYKEVKILLSYSSVGLFGSGLGQKKRGRK